MSADCTLQDVFRYLREDRYVVFVLYENEEFLGELSEADYISLLEKGDLRTTLRNCLPEFAKGA